MTEETFDFTRCRRPDGTFYGTGGKCRKGEEDAEDDVDTSSLGKGSQLTEDDLDKMQELFERYLETGKEEFPFTIPPKYDDNSGTPEAVLEICSLRDSLSQDKKTGRIEVPSGVRISGKAKELIDEWNSLDLSRVYVNSSQGNKLNVSGLGVMAGPRDSVPKDAVRGLVQYAALMRQDARLIDTPKGKVIDSYRDPFTGKRRPFEADLGKSEIDVAASQDHWNRPFGIYGVRSENDVRNTVYMPISMNVAKGESSPMRYVYRMLVTSGRIEGSIGTAKGEVEGFAKRYGTSPENDYLPRGITREKERAELTRTAKEMLGKAYDDVNQKYVPRIAKAVSSGSVSNDEAAKLLTDIAKQESKRNYFGGLLRFSEGTRAFTPYEQDLFKGINLDTSTGELRAQISARLTQLGTPPREVLERVVRDRQSAPAPSAPTASARIVERPTQSARARLTGDQQAQLKSAVARMARLQEGGLSESEALAKLTPAQKALYNQFIT